MINKQEIKYIVSAGIFALIWFLFIFPRIITKFTDSSVMIQFLIFNLGIYAFLFIFLKAIITNTSTNIKTSLGLILLFLAMDTYLPEFHVSTNGQLIPGAVLGVASTDYVFGYFAINSLHLSGIIVYLLVYVLAPILLLIASAKLLPNFVRHVG